MSFNTDLRSFFDEVPGLGPISKNKFIIRFECHAFALNKIQEDEEDEENEEQIAETSDKEDKPVTFLFFSLEQRKVFNMYLSELTNINNNVFEIMKYSLIRMYLIKTFRGRCYALGKPARGQRTWSNACTAYRCNRIIRLFVNQVKRNNVVEKKKESLNLKVLKKKKKQSAPKIRMIITKKKKNLWF